MQSPVEIDLWEGAPPDGLLQHGEAEILNDRTGPDQRLNRMFANVTRPTLTIHPPVGQSASRAAVVIFPGGGYREVWIDKEGYDIARWLNTLGLTAFVVKYRVMPVSAGDVSFRQLPEALIKEVGAANLADARRAMHLVRQRSNEWQIDPGRIGVIGFSAGGHLILRLLCQPERGDQASVDPLEQRSSQPNFSILVYPGTRGVSLENLPNQTGPIFMAQAADDELTPASGTSQVLKVLLEKNIPVEAHIYRQGQHGFGLGIEGGAVRSWASLCETWLRELGFLAA